MAVELRGDRVSPHIVASEADQLDMLLSPKQDQVSPESADRSGLPGPALTLPRSLIHKALSIVAFFVFVQTALRSLRYASVNHPWVIGDWLINYRGGFVRRGLLGEVILRLSELSGVDPVWIVSLIQITLYGIIFAATLRLVRRQARLTPFALLLCSPFIFFFQMRADGGFRKEIIVLALLGVACLASFGPERTRRRMLTATLILSPLIVLSHEGLISLLPLVAAAQLDTITEAWSRRSDRLGIIASASATAGVFFLALVTNVTAEATAAICDSLSDFCGSGPSDKSAIGRLASSSAQEREYLSAVIEADGYLLTFFWSVVLVAVAFIPARNHLRRLLGDWKAGVLIAGSAVALIAMSTTAMDWGRFLYSFAFGLFFLTLRQAAAIPAAPDERSTQPASRVGSALVRIPVTFLLIALVYNQSWTLRHCCNTSMLSDTSRSLIYGDDAPSIRVDFRSP